MCSQPRYSDGDLTLIYSGGDECSSGFQRMSVINFECNQTAGERVSVRCPPLLCVCECACPPPLCVSGLCVHPGVFYWKWGGGLVGSELTAFRPGHFSPQGFLCSNPLPSSPSRMHTSPCFHLLCSPCLFWDSAQPVLSAAGTQQRRGPHRGGLSFLQQLQVCLPFS